MSASYINGSYKVLRSQLDAIEKALVGLNSDTKHLVKHILVSGLIQKRELDRGDGFVHVPSTTIYRELRNANWRAGLHLIETKGHSDTNHIARGYRVRPEVLEAFLAPVESISASDYVQAEKVNLFDGRRINRRAKSQYFDESKHPEPQTIVAAMKALSDNRAPFVFREIEAHLQRLKLQTDEVAKRYGTISDEYRAAYGRYVSDKSCYDAIL